MSNKSKLIVFAIMFLLIVSLTIAAPASTVKVVSRKTVKEPDFNVLRVFLDEEYFSQRGSLNNGFLVEVSSGVFFDKSVLVVKEGSEEKSLFREKVNIGGIPYTLRVLDE